jgi:hypothetical protein
MGLSHGDEVGVYHVWIVRRPAFIETLGIPFRFENVDGMFELLNSGYNSPMSAAGLRKINWKLSWSMEALPTTSSRTSVSRRWRSRKTSEEKGRHLI